MAYIGVYAPATRTNSVPAGTERTERLQGSVTPTRREPTAKVTDEAILRAIGHLNDQQLDDIGICRKPRAPSWRSLGRGIPLLEISEFEYFWLHI